MRAPSKAVRAELDAIAKKRPGNTIRPVDVVKFARNPKTALHAVFDWNDTEAAEKWRLSQAGYLLRARKLIWEDAEPIRFYANLTTDRGHGGGLYRTYESVLSDKSMRAQAIEDATMELRMFRNKHAHLIELARVFEAIDALPAPKKRARA